MQRRPAILIGVGLALVTFGIAIGMLIFPYLLKSKIKSQMQLKNGTETYDRWKDTPIPIFMKVYVFNITNPDEFAIGKRPVLDELGPYCYEQLRQKVVESINVDNDTLLYRPKITYYFRPEMSIGSEDDVINLINVPLVSVATKAMSLGAFTRSMIKSIADDHGETLFTKRTVGELLFTGYYEPMIAELSALQGEVLMPDNRFGIYYSKNGTEQDLLQIYTGSQENEKFGQTISWKGEHELSFWNTEYCNMINGTDGSLFPPFVTRNRILRIFSPDMCRSIYMTYVKDIEHHGIPALRFESPKEILEDPRVYHENMCYCKNPGNDGKGCSKGGVFRLSECRKGAPVVASWPHFYDGDKEYQNQSIGLSPDKEIHETFISLEPTTGSLLQASKRFQVNLELKPNKYFPELKKVPEMLLPLLWVDESVRLPEEFTDLIKKKLITPVKVVSMSTYGILGLGTTLILVAFVLLVMPNRKNNKS